MDCIFCKIVGGEIPSDIVFQDNDYVAFKDIHPQAPVHVLVVPRIHIPSIVETQKEQAELVGRMLMIATKIAEQVGVAGSGYRLSLNYGDDANLVVPHLHLHILGGRRLNDLMG